MSRKHLLAATLLAASCGLAGAASAQPVTGLYIGAGAGANFMERQQFRSLATMGLPPLNGRTAFDTGYVAVGSIGWGFGNGLRLEAEGDYRYNHVSTRTGQAGATLSGREQKYGPMFNVLFDLDVGSPYVYPYIGAGAGYQWAQQRLTQFGGPLRSSTDDTEGSFAYQAIAGLSFPVPWVVGLSLTAEYRYFNLTDDRQYRTLVSTPGGPIGSVVKVRGDINHSLLLGLRYAFNAAPPPATAAVVTPPPAAEAARTYLVFFDWDRADLTDRGRQIVAEAAQATTRVQVTRIEVNGHTDLSGTPRYNQGLSVRRAQTVANELVRLGVPRQSISVQGYGQTRPLVPTAAGVREPQNRRVEIILH